jgi:7-keto-8-aminopelargonate synthetase-like enzyme
LVNENGEKQDFTSFNSNDYLGMGQNPEVKAAAQTAIDIFGAGLSTGRLNGGTSVLHKDLEIALAKFHGKEDAICYGSGSGWAANVGLFMATLSSDDYVFCDDDNHASIIDSIK